MLLKLQETFEKATHSSKVNR